MKKIKKIIEKRIKADPYLSPFESALYQRMINVLKTEKQLTQGKISLCDFSSGHEYFGLHYQENQWIFREQAPNAVQIYFIGTMTDWKELPEFALKPLNKEGVWEICFPKHMINHKDLYRLSIHWSGGKGDRIPAYARRVVQDPDTLIFNAQVWNPPAPYIWKITKPVPKPEYSLIYEAHIGMAQDAEKVGTYNEFKKNILPRIINSGYNTIQLMAIQQHPYYGSFGYHVSSFFAASSRFGTPEDLKSLIDTAHMAGIRVIMDLVHSHCVSNQVEGLSFFDGTLNQYFHEGPRGFHKAWDSRCFDYGKYQVIHFLLSNCRFWLDEFHVDGFRFDGITSMLYLHHGLGKNFTSYDDYFNHTIDNDALVYLTLANKVIHTLRPDAVTIAEDVSGMPGLAIPISEGGTGFDYRFAMGVPDFWIKLIKEYKDEQWHMGTLWYELTNRRKDEQTISYAESHDQALVGDQTIIFRLMNREMYEHMQIHDNNLVVDRGMALHKMIRLITLTTADAGYLNFMGNEFGHPEWIDFPRQENNWTYKYAKRQWNLVDNPELKYKFLAEFDKDMINLVNQFKILKNFEPKLLYIHEDDKIIVYTRANLVYVFNFHPVTSYTDYKFEISSGKYQMIFCSDALKYGGHGRLQENQSHLTIYTDTDTIKKHMISLYLPSRCAIVLHHIQNSEYYNLKAQEFYNNTINIDISKLYTCFCKHLKPNARILDAGCGYGKDTLAFTKMGFNVDAFDSSIEMVKLAKKYNGINAVVSNFLDYKSDKAYDGIWCCASLLHVPFNLLETVMKKMAAHLKTNGIWYVSFKYGNTEREKDGRHFTDLNEKLLNEIIDKIENLELHSIWQTTDARPDRNEVWLNALIKKAGYF